MIRIGCVNIDVSHPLAFSACLNQGNRARYTAVWNGGFRADDEVEGFIRNCGLEERCKTIEELAGKVDVGFVQSCNWDNHIAQALPFIQAGKPVFIEKPIVGSLADCRRLESLAESGARIFGSSSARYAVEVVALAAKPVEERGEIIHVFGTAGNDEFNYAIHIVEAIGGLLGTGAVACRFAGASEVGGKRCETFVVRFQNGSGATYQTCHGVWQPFDMTVTTTKTTFSFRMDMSKLYGALLDRICDAVEKGDRALVPVPTLTESIKIMLAGRLSRERRGAEVLLKDIPEDDPGFDGAKFERGYAANARKIYL